MPGGLDTQLGPTWDEGVEVSFGQWQKLALARGFMRDDPLVLARATILLPNRRAVRALGEAFLATGDGKALLLPRVRRLVVKIGSSSISGPAGLDAARMSGLVDQTGVAIEARGVDKTGFVVPTMEAHTGGRIGLSMV